MKKQIIYAFILIFFAVSPVKGQMFVGQHLNEIKKQEPIGDLTTNEGYGYLYSVTKEKQNDYFVYFLNKDLYCYLTVLHPTSSGSLQSWVELLNKRWVIIDNYHWRLYRENGSIMEAELRKVEDVDGMCLGFSLIK